MEGRSLLISDVDGTLLGNDAAVAEFAQWYESVGDRLWLAYSSGRFIDSIQRSIATTALPQPHAIIGGVGTQIYLADSQQHLVSWPAAADWDVATVGDVCQSFTELVPQDAALQSPFKQSFFGRGLSDAFLQRLDCRLRDAGVYATIVYSSNRDLDILPQGANKGTAAVWLAQQHWSFADQDVIVSGDSGNDWAMFQHGFRGVVVSNAGPELQGLNCPFVYYSPRSHAAGVVDGVEYWRRATTDVA